MIIKKFYNTFQYLTSWLMLSVSLLDDQIHRGRYNYNILNLTILIKIFWLSILGFGTVLVPHTQAAVPIKKFQSCHLTNQHTSAKHVEIVVIDKQIANYQQLVAQVTAGRKVILLDPNQDGIKQITQALSQYNHIKAIHVISHATPGRLQLGNAWLTPETIDNYQSFLTQWFSSTTIKNNRPDLLLYGCQFSANQTGTQLLQTLSQLTRADIAASNDLTGSAQLGGDWELESTTGKIEATLPFTQTIAESYQALLATIEVTTTVDENDGIGIGTGTSLREAIIEANQNSDLNDIIQLQDRASYSLDQLISPDEDNAQQGDLDITSGTITVEVKNNGIALIDGNQTDRIFHLHSGTSLVLSNVEITNGQVNSFGGGILNQGSNLTITNSILSNNQAIGDPGFPGSSTGAGGGGGGAAGLGGAIFHEGTGSFIVKDAIFSNNQAIGGEGGIGLPNGGDFSGIGGKGGGKSGGSGGGYGLPGDAGGFGSGGGGGGGSCSPGGSGGAGGFGSGGGGGGGRTCGGNGGSGGISTFGGGAGGQAQYSGAAGGGGGAGLGGAIFVNSGQITLQGNILFENNSAYGGIGGAGAWGGIDQGANGQGKGGALFLNTNATLNLAAVVDYNANFASDSANTSTDNNDIYSEFPPLSVSEITVLENSIEIPNNSGNVDLGNTPRGTDLIQTFEVKNDNDASLTLIPPININDSHFTLESSWDKTVLSPGESTTFQIKLDASSVGHFTANITFNHSDGDEDPYNFSISATVIAPEIQVLDESPLISNNSDTIDFGTTPIDTALIKTFKVKNIGNDDLNLETPISLSGNGFSLVNSFGITTIAPGQSTTFQVQLDAIKNGFFQGKISFQHNDSENNPFRFDISGTVMAGAKYASTPALSSTLSFGGSEVGSARTLTLDIKEKGDSQLQVDFIQISGPDANDFVVTTPSFPIIINDGDPAQTVTLQCTPSQAGQRTATLELSSNDPDHATITYPLKCVGIKKPSPPPQPVPLIPHYHSTPLPNQTIKMGSSLINQSLTQTIQVSESGNATLQVDVLTITGSHADEFSLLNPSFPLIIADGESTQTITVQCLPTAAGTRTANLQLSSNDPDHPTITYPLECLGTALPVASYHSTPPLGESILVGNTLVGVPITHTLFITEQGDATLTVDLLGITGSDANDFSIVDLEFPLQIQDGSAAQPVMVQCLPSVAGTRLAQLELQTNDPNNPTPTYPLICEGQIAAQAGYSTMLPNNQLDFGQTLVGTAITQQFDIQEVGNTTLEVDFITMSGEQANNFTVISPHFPITIPDGGTAQTITLQCLPSEVGPQTARLELKSNDPSQPLLTHTLRCLGIANTPAYDSIPQPNSTLEMGSTEINHPLQTNLKILTTGTQTLEVLSSQITGAQAESFKLTQGIAPFSLPVSNPTHNLTIQCLPRKEGIQTAQLLLTTNDPNYSTVSYLLTCTGLAPANQPPTDIILSQSHISEDSPGNAFIGQFTTIDPNEQTHHYTLLDNAGGLFVLKNEQLHLAATAQLDFETIARYTITVRSTDSGGLFLDKVFPITIGDVHEAQFLGKISADSRVGKRLSIDAPEYIQIQGYLQPSLKHIGQFADIIMTYHWTPDSADQPLTVPVTLVSQQQLAANMELTLFEGYLIGLTGQFDISLGYQLNNGELLSAPILTLEVRPNRLPTDIKLSNATVVEHSRIDTLIGAFTTTDPDQQDQFQHGLVENPGNYFKVVNNELRVNYPLPSREERLFYPITVRSVDRSGGYLEKRFLIEVTNIETQPQEIHLTQNTVFENSSSGTIVGRLWTIDLELGHYFYELTDNAQDRFTLEEDLLLVAPQAVLDFETQPSHFVTVRAWKLETGDYLEKTFEIKLLNRIDVTAWGEVKKANRTRILDPTSLQATDEVEIKIHLVPEQSHQGEPAELITVAVWKPFTSNGTRMYRRMDQRWTSWDGNFMNLLSNHTLTLQSQHEVTLWQGRLSNLESSEVNLLIGYRLATGEIIYSAIPFQIRVQ